MISFEVLSWHLHEGTEKPTKSLVRIADLGDQNLNQGLPNIEERYLFEHNVMWNILTLG
jgi:hypothetical protein